jgi:hypothetical protein
MEFTKLKTVTVGIVIQYKHWGEGESEVWRDCSEVMDDIKTVKSELATMRKLYNKCRAVYRYEIELVDTEQED